MSKLDLSGHSDSDIVEALFALPAKKFLTVINIIGSISQKMEDRAKAIAENTPDDVVDRMIRSLYEE